MIAILNNMTTSCHST